MSKRGSRTRMGSTNRFIFPSHLRSKTVNTTFAPNTNGRVNFRGVDNGYTDNTVVDLPDYEHAQVNQESRAAVAYNEFGDHPEQSTAILLYFGRHPSSHGNFMP